MQREEKNMDLSGDLLQEFGEMQKLVNEEVGVPYVTWSKECTSFFTLFCC